MATANNWWRNYHYFLQISDQCNCSNQPVIVILQSPLRHNAHASNLLTLEGQIASNDFPRIDISNGG